MNLKRNHFHAQATRDPRTSQLLQGEALKAAANQLAEEIQTKIVKQQNGVGTFFDNGFLGLLKELRTLDVDAPWEESVKRLNGIRGLHLRLVLPRLQRFLSQTFQGRFVDFQHRFRPTLGGLRSQCDIGTLEFAMSQGLTDCMHWKGLPVFKTVFDFSLYSMLLWNLKPQTIIELGSGTGASSIWMADLMKVFEIEADIYSIDLKKPELQYENVHFIQGDCRAIEKVFAENVLENAPHPWLLIEDAHVNVGGVLAYFHRYLTQGDYIVVEDSTRKWNDIRQFLAEQPGCYKVDTYYTDFFGRNATCAQNSIFIRDEENGRLSKTGSAT